MLLKEGHDAVDGEGHIRKLMRVVALVMGGGRRAILHNVTEPAGPLFARKTVVRRK
jgi:hypothetical protein